MAGTLWGDGMTKWDLSALEQQISDLKARIGFMEYSASITTAENATLHEVNAAQAEQLRKAQERIRAAEAERDAAGADVVAFSELAASVVEEMSKQPVTTWGQVKAAIRALGDIGDRQALQAERDRAWNEAIEAAVEELGNFVLELQDKERIADENGDVVMASHWCTKKYGISDAREIVRSLAKGAGNEP
jgi:hypothetical protein